MRRSNNCRRRPSLTRNSPGSRRRWVRSDVFQKDSIMNQAMQIGRLESVGLDWSLMDQYVARVNAVTAEQVQAVAKKILVEERQMVAVLKPLPMDAGHRPHPSLPGGGHDVR